MDLAEPGSDTHHEAHARRFERLEIDARGFSHRDHLAAAYAMLRIHPPFEATRRTLVAIRAMADRAGDPDKFSTTISVALMALIAERMASAPHSDFDDFCARHPDLLRADVLERFYSPARLGSELARRMFLMPDRAALA